jgi:hypothetical protein
MAAEVAYPILVWLDDLFKGRAAAVFESFDYVELVLWVNRHRPS